MEDRCEPGAAFGISQERYRTSESAVTRSVPVLRQLESEPRRSSTSTASFPLLADADKRSVDGQKSLGSSPIESPPESSR